MSAEWAWLLAVIPACAFIVLALFGRSLPRQGDWLGVLTVTSILGLLIAIFTKTFGAKLPMLNAVEWTSIGDFSLSHGIAIDWITLIMLPVIIIVALMVNIFSIGYMRGEPRYSWYFAVLQLFVASMLLLVLADNLLLLYIAWELVGVCSFLLIGF